jgi:DNA repair protein RadC
MKTATKKPALDLSKISDNDLQKEYNRRYFPIADGIAIRSSQLAKEQIRAHFVDQKLDLKREHFVTMYLSARNACIQMKTEFSGTLDSSAVYPREIVREALECGAKAVIFAHNHPSGNPNASRDDLVITKRLKEALQLFDIVVHDHLIIAGDNTQSMTDLGLI